MFAQDLTFYFGDLLPYIPLLVQGLLLSILVTVVSYWLGFAFGAGIYVARAADHRVLRGAAKGFIELMRNTPLLVQLYLVYFGLPTVGVNLDPLAATVVAMTLNNSAYVAEILRAGIEAVPSGQWEAGRALGLRASQVFRDVVFVPAFRTVLPSLTNQFIILFLFSSVGSVISLTELTSVLEDINQRTLRTLEVFSVGGLLYYLTSTVIAQGSALAERRLFRW